MWRGVQRSSMHACFRLVLGSVLLGKDKQTDAGTLSRHTWSLPAVHLGRERPKSKGCKQGLTSLNWTM